MLIMIADGLTVRDQKNCTLVCREWNTLFCRTIFRVVDTNTREKFYAFRAALRSKTSTKEQIGPYARKLIVRDGYMTQQEMEEFKNHCPNLRHLTFLYKDNFEHGRILTWLKENTTFRSNHKFFGVPRQLVETLPITSLTLECGEDKSGARGIGYCRIYLSGCSNLQTLILTRVFYELSLDLIGEIHRNCPNLTTLQVKTHRDTIGLRARHNSDKKFVDNLKEKKQSDTKALRHLRLEPAVIDAYRVLCWLECFALQYPELESLIINAASNAQHSIMEPTGEEATQSCILLAERCQSLHTISLKNAYLDVDLLCIFLSRGNYLHRYAFTSVPI